MYTDPDPQFLAPTQSLEIGRVYGFFDVPTWQPYCQLLLNTRPFLTTPLTNTSLGGNRITVTPCNSAPPYPLNYVCFKM